LGHGAERAKAHQLLLLLVPQIQKETSQARPERKWLFVQHGILIVAFLQEIVGRPGAEVMNVMHANVAAKPLEEARQLVVRAAL